MFSEACDVAVVLNSIFSWSKKIIFSAEAHFDLQQNKQNCRIWGTENPHAYTEKPTHPNKSLFDKDFGPEV